MSEMELGNESVAVVTGAGSGIGLALAEAFAAAGCSLVVADVQDDALDAATKTLRANHGVDVLAVRTDVGKPEQVDALAAATMEHFGRVHVVCNNAGVAGLGDPWFGGIESWQWVMNVNFWGVVYGIRAFLPHIAAAGAGHIVNTASMAGLIPGFSPAYDASKHAVVAISEGLYSTLQTSGLPIGVSCLCPGWIRTGILEADRNWPDELGDKPTVDAAGEVTRKHVGRALAEGMQPAAVADHVVDAVRAGRYWVFPNPDFVEIAMARFHTIGDGVDPQPVEQMPGMPPRSQIVAEVMEALFGTA
jgi:NAD(P)-dependent dehydrogenase (short-subunit alcohol dehydrogenase family)